MKKITTCLIAFLSFLFSACQYKEVPSGSDSSSTNKPGDSISIPSIDYSDSKSDSPDISVSLSESISTTESLSPSSTDSSKEEPVYDEAYLIGYGSYLTGTGDWQNETGISLIPVEDQADALEKYYVNIDLKVDDVFLIHLMSTPERWYNFDDLQTVTHPAYDGTFFESIGDKNIKTMVSGNYTIYFTVWNNYTSTIWIDVNSFELPSKADDAYMMGYGSYYPQGSESWSDVILLTPVTPEDETAIEKYTLTIDLLEGDVILFHLLSEEQRWYGYDSLNCEIKESNFSRKDTNNIEITVSGNYTFYMTIWGNYTATIWCCKNG